MKNAAALMTLKVTKKTTLDSIVDHVTACGYEFYWENARELKAEILSGVPVENAIRNHVWMGE